MDGDSGSPQTAFTAGMGLAIGDLEPLVRSGMTLGAIAGRLGCSISTARYWIARHDLPAPIVVRRGDRISEEERRMGLLERRCRTHGITTFILDNRGGMRCRQCRQDAVSRRRRKIKLLLVEEAGGRCSQCGYDVCVGGSSSTTWIRPRRSSPFRGRG